MRDSIWMYGWDLKDEGADACLRRIREVGRLGAISLAASYHAGRFLLPHNPRRKVMFLEDGKVYFHPDPNGYGRIRPLPHSEVEAFDFLGEAGAGVRRFGLELNAWCSICHNTALGSAHPDCTIENAFGDRYLHSLCPSHPDVQGFALGLVRDLAANHDVDAIEIESLEYLQFRHGFHHEREGIQVPPAIEFLLGLCFCSHCTDRAASRTDPGLLRERVRARLVKFFDCAYPTPSMEANEIVDWLGPESAMFFAAREDTLCDLHRKILDVAHDFGKRIRRLLRPAKACWAYGLDPTRLSTDEFVLLAYHTSIGEFTPAVSDCLVLVAPDRVAAGLRTGFPDIRTEEDLCARVLCCRRRGIQAFSFFSYSLMRLGELEVIGRALGGNFEET